MARKSSSSGVVWQVLAPVLRWPLASPRRLGLMVLAVVAALLLVSLVNGRSTGQAAPTSSPPTTSTTETATPSTSVTSSAVEGLPGSTPTAPGATHTGSDADQPAAAVSDRYVTVAHDFVVTYLAAGSTDPTTWQQQIKPLVSDALYPGMVAIDPTRVTTASLTSVHGVSPASDGGGIAEATLSNNQALDVTVASTPEGALVVVAFAPHA
jgi:hypothetical protein